MCVSLSLGSEGSVSGHWVQVAQPVNFVQGDNELLLLSETVGLQVNV